MAENQEKLTVEVKAKDCKKCFLYGHCDYILYAICTEIEKGRNTKGEEQYDKGANKETMDKN